MKTCCIEPTYDELIAAIASAREKTEKISKLIVNDLYYQYGYCERPEHHVLSLYEDAATAHLNELSAGVEPCLKCEEIRNVVEGIRGIVGEFCDCSDGIPELQVDKSKFQQWATEHPDCVPYKTWEAAIYAECNRVGLRVVAENLDLTCQKVVLHRRATEVLCKIPHKKLVEEILCDVEIKPKPVSLECEIKYSLLPEEVKCEIEIDTFATLIDCGFGVDLIAQCIDCGLGFNITPTSVEICDNEGQQVEAIIIPCCDQNLPVVIVVENVNVLCAEDEPTIQSQQGVTASGGCGELTISWVEDIATGTCPRIVFRTWIAEDECGTLSDVATQVIISDDRCVENSECNDPCSCNTECCVEEVGDPAITIECLPDAVYNCLAEVPIPEETLEFTGGCGEVQVQFLGEGIPSSEFPKVFQRYYLATDACLPYNATYCIQTITVLNSECE